MAVFYESGYSILAHTVLQSIDLGLIFKLRSRLDAFLVFRIPRKGLIGIRTNSECLRRLDHGFGFLGILLSDNRQILILTCDLPYYRNCNACSMWCTSTFFNLWTPWSNSRLLYSSPFSHAIWNSLSHAVEFIVHEHLSYFCHELRLAFLDNNLCFARAKCNFLTAVKSSPVHSMQINFGAHGPRLEKTFDIHCLAIIFGLSIPALFALN